MKKCSFLLVALSTLVLSGCGGTPSVSSTASSASNSPTSSTAKISSSNSSKTGSSSTPSTGSSSSGESSSSSTPSSSDQSSSSTQSSSQSSSSSTEEKTTIITKVNPDDYASVVTSNVVGSKALNNAFTLMDGMGLDSTNKSFTVDDQQISVAHRFKLNGKGSTTARSLQITTHGTNAIFRFVAQSGKNSDETRTYAIADSAGNVLFTSEKGVTGATATLYSYTFPTAGSYFLYSPVNGFNLYYLDLTETVTLGNETGFELDSSLVKKSYLTGDDLDLNGLAAYAVYSTGYKIAVASSKYTVDSSAYQKDVAGTYTIKVAYKGYAEQSFDVVVTAVRGLAVYTSPLMVSSSSKDVKRTPLVYGIGGSFDASAVVVKALTSENEVILPKSAYTVSSIDTSTAGEKTVAISYENTGKTYSGSFKVTVIDASLLVADASGVYNVKVVAGTANEGSMVDGVMTFSTIQKANDFLAAAGLDETAKKTITVADGIYTEKVYFTVPSLSLIGASNDPQKATIDFNAYADTVDEQGSAWSTFGSATVTIAATATDFKAKGIGFANGAFTDMDDYLARKGNLQACAITTIGEKGYYENCGFYGFQDTLYAYSGTQYFKNCHIEGMTDFIFGETNNAVFEGCSIEALNKKSTTNNGYICAPRPANLTATDVGFVFLNCALTGESGIAAGTVSLGRPWGANAKITYAKCTMDAAYSKKAYPSSETNARYEIMSANLPTKADFEEYLNTGDGSISEAVAGCTFMSEANFTALSTALTSLTSYANN